MVGQPILNIDKFAGSGESGILYNQGFYPEIDNGKSVMGEGFYNYTLANTSTSGYSNLGSVVSILSLGTIYNRSRYSLFLNSAGKFFSNVSVSGVANGEVHSNSQQATDFPCMLETSNGNILYTCYNYIGRGVRGKVISGSTTTLVTNKDLTALGYAAGDKVTNLKTGIEYSVTSISGSGNTTLNFSASGTNTNTANDEYIIWEDDRLEITGTQQDWQPSVTAWNRQIKQYGSQYLFGAGNYLGAVSADEGTVDTTYKQLPFKHQLLAFDINVSMVLISAEFNGKGVLCLWDGYSDGFNNLLELDSPVKALIKYKSGWVYVLNNIVYYTDGYQIQRMSDLNLSPILSQRMINPYMYNSLTLYRGLLYCAVFGTDLNLINSGVYIIDLDNPKNGWTIVKSFGITKENYYPVSLFLTTRFSDYQTLLVGGGGFVNTLVSGSARNNQNKSLLMYINLPQYTKVSGIGINFERPLKEYCDDQFDISRDVQVAIGDGNRGLISIAQVTGITKSTLSVNKSTFPNNEVGDEIVITNTSDATYDERAFITNIEVGTPNDTWTVSPEFSDVVDSSSDMRMIRVKKCDKITVRNNDLKKEYWFASSGIETNKLYIEIVYFGNDTSLPLNITNIKVYGN